MVAPMWQGVELIVDNVTQVKQGEVVLSRDSPQRHFKIIRAAGFYKQQTQHA